MDAAVLIHFTNLGVLVGGGGGGADDQTPEVNIVKKIYIYILLNMYFKKWSSHCCETVV